MSHAAVILEGHDADKSPYFSFEFMQQSFPTKCGLILFPTKSLQFAPGKVGFIHENEFFCRAQNLHSHWTSANVINDVIIELIL